ncbi:MAG TPA: diphthine--ammonia ligase [Candidatus Methanomethylicus sp.]|nr:diphthine--ammonia ligase [Candidatus Methanomethylicus sp.]
MKTGVLFSGGKDSNLAVCRLLNAGHEVAVLISAIPKRDDSWMFHVPNIERAGLQAESMGYPWERVEVSGVMDAELAEFERGLLRISERWGLEAIGTGAIASRYQRDRVEGMCRRLGLECISPLWAQNEEGLLKEMLALGFDVIFTSVSAEGLTKDWLGSRLYGQRISSLLKLNSKYRINISGEGGEYETFVCDSPLFKKRIKIISASLSWRHNSGTLSIDNVELVDKDQVAGVHKSPSDGVSG